MDFGSAGPLLESIDSRRDQLEAIERASTHTTISYRPPELFEGGIRVGDTVDYEKVDVYGLACTLFAASYGQGASPCECEFVRGTSTTSALIGAGSVVRGVECTHLKVLAGLPSNPPNWYSDGLWTLLEDMMQQDPSRRPALLTVMERVQLLLEQAGGTSAETQDRHFAIRPGDEDDIELANRFL
jgi:serine/threonine kinase 16